MKFKVSCSFVRKARLHHLLTYPGVSVAMEGWLLVDNSSASSVWIRPNNREQRDAKAEAMALFIFDEMSRCLRLSKAYQQAGRERGVGMHQLQAAKGKIYS
jgi:hypothetical protein